MSRHPSPGNQARHDFSRPPASGATPQAQPSEGATEVSAFTSAVIDEPQSNATEAAISTAMTWPLSADPTDAPPRRAKPVCASCGYEGNGATWFVPGKGPEVSCASCGKPL